MVSDMPIQTQRLYERVVGELRDRLVANLGDELDTIVLYGSVARREGDVDSDIDLLIIGRNKRALYERAADIRFATDLEHETLTTLIVFTPEQFERSLSLGEPLLLEVLREGRVLYGESKFSRYQRALQALR